MTPRSRLKFSSISKYSLRVPLITLILVLATFVSPSCLLYAQSPVISATIKAEQRKMLKALQPFKGKKIVAVKIEVREIFDDPNIASLYRTINAVKVNTRDEVVRRELLFKEGDIFDPFLAQESGRLLRELRYLREVEISPHEIGPNEVEVLVRVQDTWTLLPQFNYSSGGGKKKKSAGISESNLAGLGKRLEFLVEEDDKRSSFETVAEDSRFLGTFNRVLLAYFDRSDGERFVGSIGRPFRSLVDKDSWVISTDTVNSVGRLYENGDEKDIFRQKLTDFSSRYTLSEGNPEVELKRYAIGYDYSEARFYQADNKDYDDVALDPTKVGNAIVPTNRRFSGPVLTFQSIVPEYIQMNYIDRFDRTEDYNLGREYSVNLQLAPEVFGSSDNALLFSGSSSQGVQFNEDSFLRGEVGAASRYETDVLKNTLGRFELKYYNVFGPQFIGQQFVGKHTFAAQFFLDYGRNLDEDRQFIVGSDSVLRGYKAQSFVGDKRFGLNIEDRAHLAEDVLKLVSVGAAAFVDIGGATYKPIGNLLADGIYSDVGVGLRFEFPRSAGGTVLRTDIAVPLRDGPDGTNSIEFRVVFAGGSLFNARLRSESLGPEKANVAVGVER